MCKYSPETSCQKRAGHDRHTHDETGYWMFLERGIEKKVTVAASPAQQQPRRESDENNDGWMGGCCLGGSCSREGLAVFFSTFSIVLSDETMIRHGTWEYPWMMDAAVDGWPAGWAGME